MLYHALASHLKSSKLEPCYVIRGNDPYLKSAAIEAISALADNPMFNLNVFEQTDDEQAIVGAMRILPMGSDYRVVLVGELSGSALTGGAKAIINYLKDPEPSSILIINDRGGKIYETIAKHAQTVECDKMNATSLKTLVTERLTNIQPAAASAIVEYCGQDMGRILLECDKLNSYSNGALVTLDMVEQLVHKDTEYKIFEFTGALSDKNVSKAYEIWGEMRRTDPTGMLPSLINHFRRLLYVAISSSDDTITATNLGVRVEALRFYLKSAKNFTPMKLKKIIEYLNSRDFLIKSGDTSAEAALNNTLLRILNI